MSLQLVFLFVMMVAVGSIRSLFGVLGQQHTISAHQQRSRFAIGGLFPIHEKSKNQGTPCGKIMERRGIHRQEAMYFAIDQINENNAILPGTNLTALILDTCADPIYALNQSLHFIRDLMGNMDLDNYQCLDGSVPSLRYQRQPVAGVIGEAYSDVTIQTANLLKLFNIVQISPASTSAVLSDKHRYYYFARTVPPDNFQAKALVDFAHVMNWTYVSIVYSAGDYGEKGAEEFKKAAKNLNICIALEEKISRSEDLSSIVANLRRTAEKDLQRQVGARVVVLFATNLDTRRLLKYVADVSRDSWPRPNLIWLAADGWEMTDDTTKGSERIAVGAITTSLQSSRVLEFEEYFRSLNPINNKRNPWFREFWEQHFNCSLEPETLPKYSFKVCDLERQSLRSFQDIDDKIEFVIDAVYALAIALHNMWLDECVSSIGQYSRRGVCREMSTHDRGLFGEKLYNKYLMNVSFTGSTGKQFKFDAHGDGPAVYDIKNFHWTKELKHGKYETVGTWVQGKLSVNPDAIWWVNGESSVPLSRCSAECPVGQVRKVQAGDTCCWVCVPCKDNEYVADDFTCLPCGEGEWPELDKKRCYIMAKRELQHMEWDSLYSIIPSVLAGIGVNLTLFVIAVFIMYNDTPVVKASGRELSYLMLSGMLICYLMTYVILAKPTPFSCALKRVGVGLGFALLYAALLVKTNRIFRIFDSARLGATRPHFISPLSQVVITVLLVCVQVVGSIIWIIADNPTTRFHYPDPQPQVVLKCRVEEHWFLISQVYNMVLIIVCTVYAVKTRMVPENFNETKFIGFTMYTTCIIWLAFVPIYFGTGNNFKIQTTTLCISVTLSATVALVCLYSPKLWIVFFESHKNVRKATGQFVVTNPAAPTSPQYSNSPSIYSPLVPKNSLSSTVDKVPLSNRASKAESMGARDHRSLTERRSSPINRQMSVSAPPLKENSSKSSNKSNESLTSL